MNRDESLLKIFEEKNLAAALQIYSERNTSKGPTILEKIEKETLADLPIPQMMSSPYQGRLLAMISKMIRPQNILEIGTFSGYSTICLAEGLNKDSGRLHTIDKNGALKERVSEYFKEANLSQKVIYHLGNALEVVPTLDLSVDLVFIDADKKNYSKYYELVFGKVTRGGFILVDNVLWKGKVLEADLEKLDSKTRAIVDFNDMVMNDPKVEVLLLNVRDGLTLIHKK